MRRLDEKSEVKKYRTKNWSKGVLLLATGIRANSQGNSGDPPISDGIILSDIGIHPRL